MTDIEPNAFAREWVDAWNRRDLPAILAHYADDVRFVSPRAARVTGNAVVVGKSALADYWSRALLRAEDVKFALEQAIWDPERRMLAVVYTQRSGGSYDGAIELFHFRSDGIVDRGEAMYGALASRGVPVA